VRALLTRAIASWWIRFLLSAAILGFLATTIDMAAAGRAVLAVDRSYLAMVLALVAVDRLVMIVRWLLLLRESGVAVNAGQAARIFLISAFVGSFLPSGIGGDAARVYGLSRATNEGSEALASVIVDRLLGILSIVVMGAFGLLAWTTPMLDWRAGLAVGVLVIAAIATLFADRLLKTLLMPVPSALSIRLVRVMEALGRYRGRGRVLAHVMTWSIAVQLLRIVQAYLLGLGLSIDVPFAYYLMFMPLGLLMLLLPISVSGFGLPQGAIVWLLRPMGVPDEQSFALSTLIVLTGLAGNLPGLWLWLAQRPRNSRG
jgi:uncharacterized protein (TIRG00374 family)